MTLSPVEQTMLMPLLGRAAAARRWPDALSDPTATRVAERLAQQAPLPRLGDYQAAVYGLRHRLAVVEIRRYLADHPGAAVVMIGCGLDRVVDELPPGTAVHNLELPAALALRQDWLGAHPHEVNLPGSVTDHAWLDRVDTTRGLIAVASGVFYYLQPADVAALVWASASAAPPPASATTPSRPCWSAPASGCCGAASRASGCRSVSRTHRR